MNRFAGRMLEALGGSAAILLLGKMVISRPWFFHPNSLKNKAFAIASIPQSGKIALLFSIFVAGWAIGWWFRALAATFFSRQRAFKRADARPSIVLRTLAWLLFGVELVLFLFTKPETTGRAGFITNAPGGDQWSRWGMVYLSGDLWMSALGIGSFAVALLYFSEQSIELLTWLRRRKVIAPSEDRYPASPPETAISR
jgi:hypothetical protein